MDLSQSALWGIGEMADLRSSRYAGSDIGAAPSP